MKKKGLLKVTSLLLLIAGSAYTYLYYLGIGYAEQDYRFYLEAYYLPAYKKTKGEWPKSLMHLEEEITDIRKDAATTTRHMRLVRRNVLKIHLSARPTIKALRSDDVSFDGIVTFNWFLRRSYPIHAKRDVGE